MTLASLIDHTLLRPEATRRDVERLCREAAEWGFAAVCVNPMWVTWSAKCLGDAPVKVCSVVGFPLGAHRSETKAGEARRAVEDGARELDVMVQLGALRSGDDDQFEQDVRTVVDAAGRGVAVKAILETSLLSHEEIVKAARLAERAGAHFVKTSTGFAGGATVQVVALLRANVGPETGIKASGGVRTRADALALVQAGATRIGTSASLQIVRDDPSAKGGVVPR